MAETSYPFETSQVTTELQWSRMARRWGLDGVHADKVSNNDLKVSGSGAATVAVAPGSAHVNGFYYNLDATKTLNVPTNAGGTPRVDLVVLRADQSANKVTAEYKTGGTVAPDLTQDEAGTWEIPVAQCTIAAGSSVVTAANVADRRWFSPKGLAPSLSGARRPPSYGQLIAEGNDVYVGDGSQFLYLGTGRNRDQDTYTPVWTAGSTGINWGTGSQNTGRYRLLAPKLCWVAIQLGPTGNPPAYEDTLGVSLPFPCISTYRSLFTWNYTSGNDEGSAIGVAFTLPSESTTKIARFRYPVSDGNSSSSTPNTFSLFTNDPFNIRSGDFLTLTGTYELA